MATNNGVIKCWGLLESVGLRRPFTTDAAAAAALGTWSLVLGDVSDERLLACTVAWLRGTDTRFWPMPGALLAALPQAEALDDSEQAWAQALDVVRRIGVLYGLPSVQAMGRLGITPERAALLSQAVGSCGGWRALGLAEDDAMTAHRASFRACYRSLRQRQQVSTTEARVGALLDGPPIRLLPGGRT